MSVTRWTWRDDDQECTYMERVGWGEWVTYDDYAALKAKADKLAEALDRIAGFTMSQFSDTKDLANAALSIAADAVADYRKETK